MRTLRLPLILMLLINSSLKAQDYDGFKGASSYVKHVNSHVSPELEFKHGFGIGMATSTYGQYFYDLVPSIGMQASYNFYVLKKRQLKFSRKKRYRNEVMFNFTTRFTILTLQERIINFAVYHPVINTKGRFISTSLFSEYGLAMHRTWDVYNDLLKWNLDLTIETIRLRFGKSLFLQNHFYFDLNNKLGAPERINLGFSVSLQYAFLGYK